MRMTIIICAAVVLFGTGYARAGTWTTLPDYPGEVDVKVLTGYSISGSNILRNYYDSSNNQHNVIYNLTTQSWTELPGYPGAWDTAASGIDGSNIVGSYNSGWHGFLYNGTRYTSLDYPGSASTTAQGIDGNKIVGSYSYYANDPLHPNHGPFGFLYNGTNWTTLSYPGMRYTSANDVSGNNIVGIYQDSTGQHGFLYNGTSYTSLDYPGATMTSVDSISGSNIVGTYNPGGNELGSKGFIYNITTQSWTKLSYPGSVYTSALDIDGDNIIGEYYDSSDVHHYFLYTIPEPASLLLLGLGGLALRYRKR